MPGSTVIWIRRSAWPLSIPSELLLPHLTCSFLFNVRLQLFLEWLRIKCLHKKGRLFRDKIVISECKNLTFFDSYIF